MSSTDTAAAGEAVTVAEPELDDRARLWAVDGEFPTLREVYAAAHDRLPAPAWDFLEGGAADERTLTANETAFHGWEFLPRALPGTGRASTASTLLDSPVSAPLFVCPFGFDRLFHPDGALAVARACAALGVAYVVPEMCSYSLEEVAAAADGAAPLLFQLTPIGDEDHVQALAERARAAGYRALCVTVDAAMPGWRERSMRDGFAPDASMLLGNYRGPNGASPDVLARFIRGEAATWTWQRLGAALSGQTLPWMVKGVLTVDDARAAVTAGAAAVLVSNHGARQLDGVPAALDQLVEVRAAVGDGVPVLVDGGVRRGSDVAVAVALGAVAAGVGRLAARGLAAAGEAGVRRTLELLIAELTTTLTLLGTGSVEELDTRYVRKRGARP